MAIWTVICNRIDDLERPWMILLVKLDGPKEKKCESGWSEKFLTWKLTVKYHKISGQKISNVKMDDLKLSMHELHKFTLTSLTVYFISKDRLIGWLFFSFRDRIISFFENVHIQSFEPFIKNLLNRSQRIFGPSTFSLLDRLLSSFCIVQFRFFVPSIFCLLGRPINYWTFHYQLIWPFQKWTVWPSWTVHFDPRPFTFAWSSRCLV